MTQDMKAVMNIHSQGSIGSCLRGSRGLSGQRVARRHHGQYLHKISSLNNDNVIRRHLSNMLILSYHIRGKRTHAKYP